MKANYCTHCGERLKDNAEYCHRCGKYIALRGGNQLYLVKPFYRSFYLFRLTAPVDFSMEWVLISHTGFLSLGGLN
ncbi:MAG: zinc ribbon domain-containing protein [Lachnotalea sp.]